MATRAIDVYLNDHLAGSTVGADLADQLRQANRNEPLGDVMATVHGEIQQDRQALQALMERMGIATNPIKQAGAWVAEKAGRLKFGEDDLGTFLALESLSLGIEGKASLWRALREVQGEHPEMASMDFGDLLGRAEAQRAVVEDERSAACRRALLKAPVTA